MKSFKENLLLQFSIGSFVIILILGLVFTTILSKRLNQNIELLEAHNQAMDEMMHDAGIMTHIEEHDDPLESNTIVDDNEMMHEMETDPLLEATAYIEDSDPFSISSLTRNVTNTLWISFGFIGGSFAFLYLSLVAIVGHGWRTIKKQQIELAANNEELQQLQDKLALILNSVADGIFGLDLEGSITFMNPRGAEMIGWQEEEIIGRRFHDIVCHSKSDQNPLFWEESPIFASINVGTSHHSQNDLFWKKDGSEFPVEYISAPIRKRGNLIGAVVSFRDMTERKRYQEERANLEQQLHQSQKMETIGTLAGGIAHDLNNMLTPIIGYSDMALDYVAAESKGYIYVNKIKDAGKRAKELVKQILTFSRQYKQEYTLIKIPLLIEEVIDFLRASLPPTIKIHHTINPTCGLVLADQAQIYQMLMNLCTNAYQAMGERGGTIEITLEPVAVDESFARTHTNLNQGSYLRLAVSDTGHGMDRTTMERIFEPFFTTKEVGEGTGLGLSLVHGIVINHDGEIIVESQLDKGTTFYVYLPQAEDNKGQGTFSEDPASIDSASSFVEMLEATKGQ